MDLKPFPRIGTVQARTDGGTVPRPMPMASNLGSKRNSRKARKKKGLLAFDNNEEGITSFVEKAVAKLDTCFFGCSRSGTQLKAENKFSSSRGRQGTGKSLWGSICRTIILDRVSFRCTHQLMSHTNQLRSDESKHHTWICNEHVYTSVHSIEAYTDETRESPFSTKMVVDQGSFS